MQWSLQHSRGRFKSRKYPKNPNPKIQTITKCGYDSHTHARVASVPVVRVAMGLRIHILIPMLVLVTIDIHQWLSPVRAAVASPETWSCWLCEYCFSSRQGTIFAVVLPKTWDVYLFFFTPSNERFENFEPENNLRRSNYRLSVNAAGHGNSFRLSTLTIGPLLRYLTGSHWYRHQWYNWIDLVRFRFSNFMIHLLQFFKGIVLVSVSMTQLNRSSTIQI